MLRVIQKGILATSYQIEQEGVPVATLRSSILGNRAEIRFADLVLRAHRSGILKLRFGLERDGEELASATQPSMWTMNVDLDLAGHRCQLRRRGILHRTFELYDGEEQIGRVVRTGWITKTADVEMPDDWPLPLQIFAFWIVLVIWKRLEATTR